MYLSFASDDELFRVARTNFGGLGKAALAEMNRRYMDELVKPALRYGGASSPSRRFYILSSWLIRQQKQKK